MQRPPEDSSETELAPYARIERWGSCIAHGNALIVGLPVYMLFPNFPWFLAPCPVVAYIISRSFRRRRLAWGAFQGMQAALVQLLILLLAATASSAGFLPQIAFLLGILLFLYSLAGALDTFLGHDFRYVVIGNWMERASRANLERSERRRRWLGGRGSDRTNRGE